MGRPATIHPLALSPLKVKGERFKPRETVRLTVRSGQERLLRRVRATRARTFTTEFEQVFVDRCNSDLWISAVGGRGSRAVYKLPMLQCPPAP